MLDMTIPWWELIVRGGVVYAFLLLILRISGKRQVGQLAPFDLVLLLVLSNAVQNSMNGGDNSLVGGMISAATLVALNYAVSFATYKSKRLEAIIEGGPQIFIHNGKVFEDVMSRAQLTQMTSCRPRCGGRDIRASRTSRPQCSKTNGSISVVPRSSAHKHEGGGLQPSSGNSRR